MTQDDRRFEYIINAEDVIVEVNPTWKAFAVENQGEGLAGTVEGTWLWQHLAGSEVKHLYRTLLERVRESGKSVSFPFRCDAPELRRSMMMEVTPSEGGVVGFASWTLEEVTRPRIDLIAADRTEGSSPLLRMCAWCKRIGEGKDGWRVGGSGGP
jgi:hypothetical protein